MTTAGEQRFKVGGTFVAEKCLSINSTGARPCHCTIRLIQICPSRDAVAVSYTHLDVYKRQTVHTLAFDHDGRRLFAASRAGRIEVFDTASGRRTGMVDALEYGALERMAVAPDGQYLVTGHSTGALVLWHRASDDAEWLHRTLLRHAAAVRGLAFAADGRRVISAGADGRRFVTLPVNRGRWARRLGPGPAFKESDETVSPDGRWIARSSGLGSPELSLIHI